MKALLANPVSHYAIIAENAEIQHSKIQKANSQHSKYEPHDTRL